MQNKRRIKRIDTGKLLFREVKARSGFNKGGAICFVCSVSPINFFMKNAFCIKRAAIADKGCGEKTRTVFFNKIGAVQIAEITSGTLMLTASLVFA